MNAAATPIDTRIRHRARRVQLNRLIRQETYLKNAVPILCQKWWAKAWRSSLQARHTTAIQRHKRELAGIAKVIGPPPKFWKPRK